MNQDLPPTQNQQEWPVIIVVFICVLFFSWTGFIYFVWRYQNQLHEINNYQNLIFSFLNFAKELLLYKDTHSFHAYWSYVKETGNQYTFFLYAVLPSLPALGIAFLAGKFCYVDGGINQIRHMSGPKLLKNKHAINHSKKYTCKKERGINLHPEITISQKQEQSNIFLLGNMGAGKTSIQINLYQQIIDRGVPVFIFDYKKEFTSYFYDETKTILVSVNDVRATPWMISKDVTNRQEAINIANNLIIRNDRDPFWTDGCSLILAGLMISNINTGAAWGWNELAKLIRLPIEDLKIILEQDFPDAADFIKDSESKMSLSFKVTLMSQLNWVISLAEYWPNSKQEGFSVKEWIRSNSKSHPILIVQHDVKFNDVTGPLTNTLISLIYSELISLNNDPDRQIWLLIDELGHLPVNKTLESWLAVGRSKGCRSVIATQTYSKLIKIYGKDLCNAILDLFEILYVLRLSGSDSAEYIIKRFGKRKVERPTSSSGPEGKPVRNWHGDEIDLISSSDLIHLPKPDITKKRPITSYLMIQGWQSVYQLEFPFSKLKPLHAETIPKPSPKDDLVINVDESDVTLEDLFV